MAGNRHRLTVDEDWAVRRGSDGPGGVTEALP